MPTYVLLSRYSDQGMRNVGKSPQRIDDLKQVFKQAGAEIKQVFLLMGRYDSMLIIEAPDDQTLARLCLGIGAAGNVHTETLRAFTEEEFRKIAAALP